MYYIISLLKTHIVNSSWLIDEIPRRLGKTTGTNQPKIRIYGKISKRQNDAVSANPPTKL